MATSFEIRPLHARHATLVAQLHQRAFEGSFLSSLGPEVLELYYGSIVDFSQFGLVAVRHNELVGFVVGIDGSCGFYRKLLWSRGGRLARALVPAVLRKPAIIFRVLGAVWQRSHGRPADSGVHLTSIGVVPEMSGKGLGKSLLCEFSRRVAGAGYRRIVLETDASHNERVCQFFARGGFTIQRRYTTLEGRRMIEFQKTLYSLPRT